MPLDVSNDSEFPFSLCARMKGVQAIERAGV